MYTDRVRRRMRRGESEYIGEVYLAQDDDFVKVDSLWVYRGSELEIEIPHIIQGEEVTTYDYMFCGTGSYVATPVTRVDSNNKNVTSMYYMFYNSRATTLDVSSFYTSNVTDMRGMFYGSRATTLDFSSFDTSNVTNMADMFRDSRATTLDLRSFDTSKVTNTNRMFRYASATTGYARTQADANRFNNSSFKESELNFVYLYLATDDDFDGTTNGSFRYIGSELNVEIPNRIKGIAVTRYDSMFSDSSVIGVVSYNKNVTNMTSMFQNSQATSLDLSSFDTSNVVNMTNMFTDSQATSLDLSSFDTSRVVNMSYMFQNSQATSLDLSSFDTSRVVSVYRMFFGSVATVGYARTQADADTFNNSANKPAELVFVVK